MQFFDEFIENISQKYRVHKEVFNGKTVFRVKIHISDKVELMKNYSARTYLRCKDEVFREAHNEFDKIEIRIIDLTTIFHKRLELKTRSEKKRRNALNELMKEIEEAIRLYEEKRPAVENEIKKLQSTQKSLKEIMHKRLSEINRRHREAKKKERGAILRGEFEEVSDEVIKKFFGFKNVTVLDKSNTYRAVLFAEVYRAEIYPWEWAWLISSVILAGVDEDGAWSYELNYYEGEQLPVDATVEDVLKGMLGVHEIHDHELVKQGDAFFVKVGHEVVKQCDLEFEGIAFSLNGHNMVSNTPFTILTIGDEHYIRTSSVVKILHNRLKERYLKSNSIYKIIFLR